MKKLLGVLFMLSVLVSGCNNASQPENTQTTKVEETTQEEQIVRISLDMPYYENAEGLIERNDLALTGKVVKIEEKILDEIGLDEDGNVIHREARPYTVYTVQVNQVYKGEYSEELIKIRRLGGTTDHKLYVLDEEVNIESDLEYLFILKTYEDFTQEEVYPTLANLTQSYFDLSSTNLSSDKVSKSKQKSTESIVMDGINLKDVMECLE